MIVLKNVSWKQEAFFYSIYCKISLLMIRKTPITLNNNEICASYDKFISMVKVNINDFYDGDTIVGRYKENGVIKTALAIITLSGGVMTPSYIDFSNLEENDNSLDLGLSVKWSNMNYGASKKEDPGMISAWGDTTNLYTRSSVTALSWSTYNLSNGNESAMKKYCTSTNRGYNNYIDYITTLEHIDDIVSLSNGRGWRLPTRWEWEELLNTDYCDWVYAESGNTEFGGKAGWKITSKIEGYTDKSIFLPNTGYVDGSGLQAAETGAWYWSSSLNPSISSQAYKIEATQVGKTVNASNRFTGFCLRGVKEK